MWLLEGNGILFSRISNDGEIYRYISLSAACLGAVPKKLHYCVIIKEQLESSFDQLDPALNSHTIFVSSRESFVRLPCQIIEGTNSVQAVQSVSGWRHIAKELLLPRIWWKLGSASAHHELNLGTINWNLMEHFWRSILNGVYWQTESGQEE